MKVIVEKLTKSIGFRHLSRSDIVAIVALLGWVFSLIYIQHFHQSCVSTDVIIDYFPAAQKFIDGYGYHAFGDDACRGPGYPFMVAIVTKLFQGDLFAAGKVVSAVSSVFFLLFSYLFLRRVFDSITALAAMLMTMGVNTFTHISIFNGSDLPFVFPVMASLYFTVRRDGHERIDYILASLFAGLALTVRWEGLVLPFFFFLWVGLVPRHEQRLLSKIQDMIVYILGFLVTSGPWLYVNYLLHGSPFYTEGGIAYDPNILPPAASLFSSLLQTLVQEPFDFVLRFVGKLIGSWPMVIKGLHSYPYEGGWLMAGPFWVFILVGLLFVIIRINRLRLWFLLISSVWYASLVLIHYEARFFILLLPIFSALVVFVITSKLFPDVRLEVCKNIKVRFTPGYLFGSLREVGYTRREDTEQLGISLTGLILIGLLVVTAFSTVKHIKGGYAWLSDRDSLYHELAQFILDLRGPDSLRPIGTHKWSQARYWIPQESKIPVAPFWDVQESTSIWPKLSYILYDQITDDTLISYIGDSKINELADPLDAPPNLEAVYYKPDPDRAILFRILDRNDLVDIISATASSSLLQDHASEAFDHDTQTWWSSTHHSSQDISESITFDLGSSIPINRVWILPRPGGQAFPAGLRLEVSQDGNTWQSVVEIETMAKPIQQNPQIFSFSETTSRFLRITATRLGWDEDEKGYLMSLAEVRISLAVERPIELPVFTIAYDDLFFDPLSNEVVARVHNQSNSSGIATMDFYEGWTFDDANYLGTVDTSIVKPGEPGDARISSSVWLTLEPGYCQPTWVTLRPFSFRDLSLDTYGIASMQPTTVFKSVCSPEEAVIDDFEYVESPLLRGWVEPSDQTVNGDVTTDHDPDLGQRLMRISTQAEDGFAIFRWMRVYARPQLTLQIRSSSDFIVYIRVRDSNDDSYYVQYMPNTWPSYPDDFPNGIYISYPIGVQYADGRWHWLERNVYEDFYVRTGKEINYIEAIVIRAFDDVEVADLRLSNHE